jgi:hypothetical protein
MTHHELVEKTINNETFEKEINNETCEDPELTAIINNQPKLLKVYYNKRDDAGKIMVILRIVTYNKKYFEALQDNNLIKPLKLFEFIEKNWNESLYFNGSPVDNWLTNIVKILCEYYKFFMKRKGIFSLAVKNNNEDLIQWLRNNNFEQTRGTSSQ